MRDVNFHSCISIFLTSLAVLFLHPGPATAEDVWTEPLPGVRYLHRTVKDPKWSIHVTFTDLTRKGIRFMAIPSKNRLMKTSDFAKNHQLSLATNGDMWSTREKVQPDGTWFTNGLVVSNGRVWPGHRKGSGILARIATRDSRVECLFYKEFDPEVPERWARNLIGGWETLLRNGKPFHEGKEAFRAGKPVRHPRTGLGITKDGKTFIQMVVDGRQPHSVGMSVIDMQKFFLGIGAWHAFVMDGGGSSALYIKGKGIVNKPSDFINQENNIRGRERAVPNHFGLVVPEGKAIPKGRIFGTVKDERTKKPLAGARVSVSRRMVDIASEDGFFELSQVPVGKIKLTVTVPRYARYTETFELTNGVWKRLDLSIPKYDKRKK